MMSEALVRSLSFVLLMLLGYALRVKVSKEQREGLKHVVVNLALPCVIFVSLQKAQFSWTLIAMPFLVLAFNGLMFWFSGFLAPMINLDKNSAGFRTIRMLIPSLAPGLSCFPFLLEYLGDTAVANGAFADLGNKVFVLLISYGIAMNWYKKQHSVLEAKGVRFKKFVKLMLCEPVNGSIVTALLLVAFGLSYENVLPEFIVISIDRLSSLMIPLMLVFVGLSVTLTKRQIRVIGSILMVRSALAFLLSGLFIIIANVKSPEAVMMIMLFPQSSASFWPIMHMQAVSKLQGNDKRPLFDIDCAMNVLAMSLPFSTAVILVICTVWEKAQSGGVAIAIGIVAFVSSITLAHQRTVRDKLRHIGLFRFFKI